MPLYSVEPCKKCGVDRWRVVELRPWLVVFSCLYCGAEIRKEEK